MALYAKEPPLITTASFHYSVSAYYGFMTDKLLNQVLRFDINQRQAKLYAVEGDYRLSRQNKLNKIANLIYANIGLALNLTYERDPNGNIYEINPYLRLEWSTFPWNKYVMTTLSFGEGVSYASRIPDRELRTANHAENAKRFLNYLAFEAGFAFPKYPQYQILYRLHHRSACFGLYQSSNSGSTAIEIGFRYLFGYNPA